MPECSHLSSKVRKHQRLDCPPKLIFLILPAALIAALAMLVLSVAALHRAGPSLAARIRSHPGSARRARLISFTGTLSHPTSRGRQFCEQHQRLYGEARRAARAHRVHLPAAAEVLSRFGRGRRLKLSRGGPRTNQWGSSAVAGHRAAGSGVTKILVHFVWQRARMDSGTAGYPGIRARTAAATASSPSIGNANEARTTKTETCKPPRFAAALRRLLNMWAATAARRFRCPPILRRWPPSLCCMLPGNTRWLKIGTEQPTSVTPVAILEPIRARPARRICHQPCFRRPA